MNVFTGQAEFFDSNFNVLPWNITRLTFCSNLSPLLRGVVFVGKTALGAGLDLQSALPPRTDIVSQIRHVR